jgi:hypothetical protein
MPGSLPVAVIKGKALSGIRKAGRIAGNKFISTEYMVSKLDKSFSGVYDGNESDTKILLRWKCDIGC